MVVWLRHDSGLTLGLNAGVIPREHAEQVLGIEAVEAELQHRRMARLAQAERQAEELLQHARLRADALMQAAHAEAEQMRQEGFSAGKRQALDEWHARERDHQALLLATHERLRERLAQMVAEAVRQLVKTQPTELLIRASLERLDRLALDARRLTLTVHSSDLQAARSAVRDLPGEWSGCALVTVQEDPAMAPGSCRCESDTGWVDASLDLQLEAVERAACLALAAADGTGEPLTDERADAVLAA